jgi:type IV secretion system protein VirB5
MSMEPDKTRKGRVLALGLLGAVVFFFAGPAASQGVPTIDVTNLAKLSETLAEAKLQLKEQISQNLKLDDQTLKLIEQIRLMQAQVSALEDGLTLEELGLDPETFLADILPDFADLTASVDAARAGDWESVLEGGSLGGDSLTARVDQTLSAAGMTRDEVDLLAGSEEPATARIGTAANMNTFLSVAAESSSRDAAESLTRIDGLVRKIEGTGNLKQAIDLNTRVTAELGIALANIWAMEAVQTVGLGQAGIMDAATAAEEEKYLRVKLDDE